MQNMSEMMIFPGYNNNEKIDTVSTPTNREL